MLTACRVFPYWLTLTLAFSVWCPTVGSHLRLTCVVLWHVSRRIGNWGYVTFLQTLLRWFVVTTPSSSLVYHSPVLGLLIIVTGLEHHICEVNIAWPDQGLMSWVGVVWIPGPSQLYKVQATRNTVCTMPCLGLSKSNTYSCCCRSSSIWVWGSERYYISNRVMFHACIRLYL